jgi:hypothetical protein
MARERTARIFKNDLYKSSSNKGISETFDEVVVVPEGETSDKPNAVRIVRRSIGSRTIFHAEPVNQPKNSVGPMSGGSYVALDGIISTMYPSFAAELEDFYGAINLHDRFETASEYISYSM